jgi:hypothetical protein
MLAGTMTTAPEEQMSASAVRVEPNATGRWVVRHDDESEPLSEHESATDAERFARTLARRENVSSVVLYDRYGRTHSLTSAPPVPGAEERETA